MTKIRSAPRVNNSYNMFPHTVHECEHRELLCADVTLCVEETGTNRMCIAEMHGSHVCKEHLCVQYTNYTLRPLENSQSRINTDWRFLLFDFSCGPAQVLSYPKQHSVSPVCNNGSCTVFWISAGLLHFFYINVIVFQKLILNTIPV